MNLFILIFNIIHNHNLYGILQIYKDNTFWQLYANKGSLVNSSRDVFMSGNVIIKSNSGFVLKTQSVNFKSSSNTLTAKSKVLIEGTNFKVHGNGLVGNLQKGNFILKEKVIALFQNRTMRSENEK